MLLPIIAKYNDFNSIYIRTFWENKPKSSRPLQLEFIPEAVIVAFRKIQQTTAGCLS
jgi:hypothetical protein